MAKTKIALFCTIAGFILMSSRLDAQAFPIAVGRDTTMSAGAVWGGPNGLVAILGDTINQNNVTAQLVYPPDSLIGPRISVGRTAIFPGPTVASDGTNYLLVWQENTGNINGRFINHSGNLVGNYFTIATNATFYHPAYGVLFADTFYMVGFVKADSHLYMQRVSKSGTLIGGQVMVSSNHARDISGAYDGTNFLAAWVEVIPDTDKDIYGQFISRNGTLVGANFLIDGGPNYSDNPTSMAFDGSRYLLGQHEGNGTASWLVGRFITTSGTVQQNITICDSLKHPAFPGIAFDGSNYLITWTQANDRQFMGRFWNPAGVPLNAPWVIFDSVDSKTPIGGCGYGGTLFLAIGTRLNSSFTNGDVYGRFIPHSGIEEGNVRMASSSGEFLCYPNPFSSFTTARGYERAVFTIYDVTGRIVETGHGFRIGTDLAPGVYFAQPADIKSPAARIVKIRD